MLSRLIGIIKNSKTREILIWNIKQQFIELMFINEVRELEQLVEKGDLESFKKLKDKVKNELGTRYKYLEPVVIRLRVLSSFLNSN